MITKSDLLNAIGVGELILAKAAEAQREEAERRVQARSTETAG